MGTYKNISPGEVHTKEFKSKEGIFLQVVPFYKCALKCAYCFTADRFSSDIRIDLVQFDKLMKKFSQEADKYNYILISMLGGELTESEDYYGYLSIVKKYLYPFRHKTDIELLTNLLGEHEHYKFYFDEFNDFNEIKLMSTFHNNSTKFQDKLKSNLEYCISVVKDIRELEVVFLQNESDTKYTKITKNNYQELKKLYPDLDVCYSPLLNSNASQVLCTFTEENYKRAGSKVYCHANYIVIRPEGIDNGCTLDHISHDDFLQNGFGKVSRSIICKLEKCPCYPELREDVGYIDMNKK